jgi:hypothetical protein
MGIHLNFHAVILSLSGAQCQRIDRVLIGAVKGCCEKMPFAYM